MGGKIIDGKRIAAEIRENLGKEAGRLSDRTGIRPGLAVILVGDNPASRIYVGSKEKACTEAGFLSEVHRLAGDATEEDLLSLLENLNGRKEIHGILVQLPLPDHIDEKKIINSILPAKDVDGFHPMNTGMLFGGGDGMKACTPKGCIRLLEEYGYDNLSGMKAVVVGRSNIVGKPLALMLLEKNATVEVCHSRTADLKAECLTADLIVSAVGRENLITADMVREGAVVIDVGINRTASGGLAGDVDFEKVREKAALITPVPGGVGPMTIAMLLENTLEAYVREMKKENLI